MDTIGLNVGVNKLGVYVEENTADGGVPGLEGEIVVIGNVLLNLFLLGLRYRG